MLLKAFDFMLILLRVMTFTVMTLLRFMTLLAWSFLDITLLRIICSLILLEMSFWSSSIFFAMILLGFLCLCSYSSLYYHHSSVIFLMTLLRIIKVSVQSCYLSHIVTYDWLTFLSWILPSLPMVLAFNSFAQIWFFLDSDVNNDLSQISSLWCFS